MVMKGWSLDDRYIVKTMISYLGWKMVRSFTYLKIEFKKNKILVLCIDISTNQNSAFDHRMFEGLNYIN